MKKKFPKHLIVITIISLFIIIAFPIVIHTLFKIEVSDDSWTLAVWEASDILNYGGVIISSLIVFITVLITLYINTIENKKNIENSQLEKKFDSFTKYASDILTLIPYLNGNKFNKMCSNYNNQDFIDLGKQELYDNFINLQLNINSLQLYIPRYMRAYFHDNFMKKFEALKQDFYNVIFCFESDHKILLKNCNLFVKHKDEFLTFSNQYLSLLSDYYYEKEMFTPRTTNIQIGSTNIQISYPIDKIFEDYKTIKGR